MNRESVAMKIASMRKILFHDVDGCLNTPDGASLPFEAAQLQPIQRNALGQLGEVLDKSDIDVMVLNTGRSIAASIFLAEAINSQKLKYIVAEHGAAGYSMDESSHLDLVHHAKDIPHLYTAYSSLEKIPVLMKWYEEDGADLLARKIGHHVVASPKKANLTLRVPDEVCGDDMQEHLHRLIQQHAPMGGDYLVYHHSVSDGYLDVMAEVDKGDGVQLIRHLESTQQIRTYAIGNGSNDLPMFRHVDVCICPSNSDEAVVEFCETNNGLISQHRFIGATLDILGKALPTSGSDLLIPM